jgi:hypothetical protein
LKVTMRVLKDMYTDLKTRIKEDFDEEIEDS